MTEINLVERVEGHVKIDVKTDEKEKINFGISEGPRLFEKFLVDRQFDEIPFFASRICGFCPIVHNLGAIKALENAMNIETNQTVYDFRKALNLLEFAQSHTAHLFVLTLPDFANKNKDLFSLKSKFPKKVKKAVEARKKINSIIENLAGRTVHPLTTRVGGFSKLPDKKTLEEDLSKLRKIKSFAKQTVDLIDGLDFPEVEMKTKYVSLGRKDNKYPTYDGHIISTDGEKFNPTDYSEMIEEKTKDYSTAKFSTLNGETYLTGALSRINLNKKKLCDTAKEKLEEINTQFPSYNPFHNNTAQAIETIQAIEEIEKIYSQKINEEYQKEGTIQKEEIKTKIKSGKGADAIEAPRGTLFHAYEVNQNGKVTGADIITPTAQSAANIEKDINKFYSLLEGKSENTLKKRIKELVRAYDPCLSCSVH